MNISNIAYWSAVAGLATFVVGLVLGWRYGIIRVGSRAGGRRRGKGRDGVIVLYVGNLSYKVREGDLRRFFRKYGKVISARIIRNRFNGESKGYGFVEMGSRNEAQSAISELDGKAFRGRPIVVSEAKSAKEE